MNRRSFCRRLGELSAVTLAAPAGQILAAPSTGAAPSRRYQLCLNPGAVGVRANQWEAVELAHRHGFEAVEPMAGALATLETQELQDRLADLQRKALVWGAAGLPVDFRGDESRFQTDLAALPPIAAGLQRAGVTRVGTWISPCHGQWTYLQNFQLHQRRLREVARVLKDHHLRLGLEYVGTATSLTARKFPFVHTLAETQDLIAAIDTGNVGLVLDSWHWWQADDTAADLHGLNADRIVAVDLNDAPTGREKRQQKDGERELPAATGVIEIAPFLAALTDIGYDGPVRAEPFNRALNELDNDPACAATLQALRRAVANTTNAEA